LQCTRLGSGASPIKGHTVVTDTKPRRSQEPTIPNSQPDNAARKLPLIVDAETLVKFGNSTWMTDAGALDLLVDLRDEAGGRHPYADLASRATRHQVAGINVLVAALGDIVESKLFANREKDRAALPELRRLLDDERDS